jgi:hypothetical protein
VQQLQFHLHKKATVAPTFKMWSANGTV